MIEITTNTITQEEISRMKRDEMESLESARQVNGQDTKNYIHHQPNRKARRRQAALSRSKKRQNRK